MDAKFLQLLPSVAYFQNKRVFISLAAMSYIAPLIRNETCTSIDHKVKHVVRMATAPGSDGRLQQMLEVRAKTTLQLTSIILWGRSYQYCILRPTNNATQENRRSGEPSTQHNMHIIIMLQSKQLMQVLTVVLAIVILAGCTRLITLNRNAGLVGLLTMGKKNTTVAVVAAVNEEYHHHYCAGDSDHPSCCTEAQCSVIRESTLFSSCCHHTTTNETTTYPLLITATPRSGTVFTVGLLNQLGLQVHNDGQRPGRDGMVSWLHIFEDVYQLLWVQGELHGSKFRTVLHQARDPLKSLTSIAFTEPLFRQDYESYLQRHINLTSPSDMDFAEQPEAPRSNRQASNNIYRALEFYLQWHTFIDSLQVPIFRLEDLVEDISVVDKIFASVGRAAPNHNVTQHFLSENKRQRRRLAKVNTNQRSHRAVLQWEELCRVHVEMANRVLELSQRYGYYKEIEQPICKQDAA